MAGSQNMGWLQALFANRAASPQATAPVTRVGNVYQGTPLPAGVSSLQALSADLSGGAKATKGSRMAAKEEANIAKRAVAAGVLPSDIRAGDQTMGLEARNLLTMLFGDAQRNGWPMPNSDRRADRMLDRVGYFDPRGGSIDDRNARAIAEWQRRYGFGNR